MTALSSEITVSRPTTPTVTAGMGGAVQSTTMPRPSPRLIAKLTAAGTLTPAFRIIAPVTAAGSGVGILSVPTKIPHTGALAGAGVLVGHVIPQHSRTAAPSTTGTLAGPAYAQFGQGAYPSGSGNLSVGAYAQFDHEATIDAVGTLGAAATALFDRAATTSASGSLSATAGADGAAYSVTAHFTGSGGLSLLDSVDVAVGAPLDGNGALGILAASYGAKHVAPLDGAGSLTGAAVPAFAAVSYGSGQGFTSAVVGGVKSPSSLTAVGSLVAAVKASFKRAAALSGAGTLAAAVIGRVFDNVGMNKSGQFDRSFTMSKVTGWTANTTTYPASVVADSGLIVSGGGTVTCSVHIVGRQSSSGYVHYHRIYVNGSPVGVSHNYTGGGNPYTFDFDQVVTVSDGDSVELWSYTSAGASSLNWIGAGSYMTLVL